MTIRPATAVDLPSILQMQQAIHAEHLAWDPARWSVHRPMAAAYHAWLERLLASGRDGLALVAAAETKMLGYLIAEVEEESTQHWSPRAIYLHDLFVEPGSRRLGVARSLMARLLDWSQANHPGLQLRLITAARNESARAFFESLGFRSCVVEMIRDN